MKTIILIVSSCSLLHGAASILFTSPVVSADGRTVTATATGFSGSLTPTSGITNIQVYDVYRGGYITTSGTGVTISGSTLTVLIPATQPPISNNVTAAQLVVNTGSNLTDTASNTVTTQVTNADVTASEWYVPTLSPFSTSAMVEGYWNDGSANKGAISFVGTGMCARVNGTFTQMDINVFKYGGLVGHNFVVYKDGYPGASGATLVHDWGTTDNTTNIADQGLVTGLSGAHEYDICDIASQAGNASITAVRVTGTLTGTAPTRKSILAGLGDSLNSYELITDTRLSNISQVAVAFGMIPLHVGSSGIRVGGASGNDMVSIIPPQLAKLSGSEVLSTVLCCWSSGYNDAQLGVSGSTIGTEWTALLTALYGGTRWFSNVVVLGLPPENAYPTIPATYDPFIATAASAFSSPTPLFVRTGSGGQAWVNNTVGDGSCSNGTGDKRSDNLHLWGCPAGTFVGYSKVAARQIPIVDGVLNGHSYAVSCPSTATVGVAITCTVSLHSGAAFIGDQTVTPASTGGTISGAVTPSIGSATGTFTFTPSSTGAKTITYTNGQDGWVNPSSNTVTASAFVTPTWMVP